MIEEVMDQETDSNLHKAFSYNNYDGFIKLMGLSSKKGACIFRDTKEKLVGV